MNPATTPENPVIAATIRNHDQCMSPPFRHHAVACRLPRAQMYSCGYPRGGNMCVGRGWKGHANPGALCRTYNVSTVRGTEVINAFCGRSGSLRQGGGAHG